MNEFLSMTRKEQLSYLLITTGEVPDLGLRDAVGNLAKSAITSDNPRVMEQLTDPDGHGFMEFGATVQLMYIRRGWAPPGWTQEQVESVKGLIG